MQLSPYFGQSPIRVADLTNHGGLTEAELRGFFLNLDEADNPSYCHC